MSLNPNLNSYRLPLKKHSISSPSGSYLNRFAFFADRPASPSVSDDPSYLKPPLSPVFFNSSTPGVSGAVSLHRSIHRSSYGVEVYSSSTSAFDVNPARLL